MTIPSIPNTIFERSILIDSSALFALAYKNDQYHLQAKELLTHAQKEKFPLYITNVVIIETFRLILHKLGRFNAHLFLETMIKDVDAGVLRLERMSESDENNAQSIIFKHKDHNITLTDSVNFCIMFRMGIYKMFGFDSDCFVVGLECFSK